MKRMFVIFAVIVLQILVSTEVLFTQVNDWASATTATNSS